MIGLISHDLCAEERRIEIIRVSSRSSQGQTRFSEPEGSRIRQQARQTWIRCIRRKHILLQLPGAGYGKQPVVSMIET